jgi:hypothetical protein
MIPRKPWEFIAQGLRVGEEKHTTWDNHKGHEYYMGAIDRHLTKYKNGEIWDKDDGQHHLAAVVIRCLQIMDSCGGGNGG